KNKVVDLVSGLSEYIFETTQQIAFANNLNNDRDYFRILIARMVISDEKNKLEEETARAILCLKTWICKG
ncbi:26214_t:CDS:2, partial [Racocetra persica]